MELAYSAMGVAMGVSERRGTSSGTPFSCLGMAKGSEQEKRGGGSRGRKWMAGNENGGNWAMRQMGLRGVGVDVGKFSGKQGIMERQKKVGVCTNFCKSQRCYT